MTDQPRRAIPRSHPAGRRRAPHAGLLVPVPLAVRLTDTRCLTIIIVGLTGVSDPALAVIVLLAIVLGSMCWHWDTQRPQQARRADD